MWTGAFLAASASYHRLLLKPTTAAPATDVPSTRRRLHRRCSVIFWLLRVGSTSRLHDRACLSPVTSGNFSEIGRR